MCLRNPYTEGGSFQKTWELCLPSSEDSQGDRRTDCSWGGPPGHDRARLSVTPSSPRSPGLEGGLRRPHQRAGGGPALEGLGLWPASFQGLLVSF